MGFYIEVERGVKIYLEEAGSGRPVLFIHGWPVNHKMYEYQFNVLPKHGYRCIGMDLRGFGWSDAPWNGYEYNRMADDIRVIADTLKLENATLVGFSMGGAIAIRYMARHAGHRMCSLILAAAAAPLFTRRPDYPYGMSTQEIDAIIASAYTDRPQMLRDFGANFFAEPVSEAFRNWFHQLGVDASSYGTIKSAESLRDEDLRADLAYIQVPTTILHGKLDKICPFAFAEVQHKGIRDSRLVPFEYSGHGLFHDELQKFNYEMLFALKQFTTSPRFW